MAFHFDINLIVVGRDAYSESDLQSVENVVNHAASSFSSHGLPIGAVNRYHITVADAGVLVVPRNQADCIRLGQRWAVRNDALDVFIVLRMTDPIAAGWSPVGGKCNKSATKGLRAPVVSLEQGDLAASVTFIHEIGHCLGLQHCVEDPASCGPNNFMEILTGVTRSKFTPMQLAKMKEHCFVKP